MRVAIYSTRPNDREFLTRANGASRHQLLFLEARLDATTVSAADGARAVCVFVNDRLDADVLQALHAGAVRLVALRCAGFNHVDLAAAAALGLAVGLAELLARSDIGSLHCPLTPKTRHLVDAAALTRTKRGAMLINTSRGAVVDTRGVIAALKSGQLGSLGLDVYEEEADLFFRDLSDEVLHDDQFARLLTFPNVVITGHQAFFTADALAAIAQTTLANLDNFEARGQALHPV
jgi:lactate dehydrogenase-like 2-hydroxyacid dehydrogenase